MSDKALGRLLGGTWVLHGFHMEVKMGVAWRSHGGTVARVSCEEHMAVARLNMDLTRVSHERYMFGKSRGDNMVAT